MPPARLVTLVLTLTLGGCRGTPAPSAVAEPLPVATLPTSAPEASPVNAAGASAAGAATPVRGVSAIAHLATRAVSVEVVAGAIVARDAAGHEARLTAAGTDDSPALSPDGKTVAFRRHAPTSRDAIYWVGVLEGEPELLVTEELYDGPHVVGIPLVDISFPEFSLDGARVFFRVRNGDLGAVCAVAVATKKVSWILTAAETELLRKGPYRGHFFAVRRETDVLDGPKTERCFVLDSVTGNKLRAVPCWGQGEATLQDPAARRSIGL